MNDDIVDAVMVSEEKRRAIKETLNSQAAVLRQIRQHIQPGQHFYFPADMQTKPGRPGSVPHQFATLEGRLVDFEVLNDNWVAVVEAFAKNGRVLKQKFGMIRFARILGLEAGAC